MASPSRDRVTIDLRGIGDAVRAAAVRRGMGVAQLVRRAVVMSLDLRSTASVAVGSDGQTPAQAPTQETAELTLRLPQAHADVLILNAVTPALDSVRCVLAEADQRKSAYGVAYGVALFKSREPHATV